MPATNPDLPTAASRFHEDIPHRFQVSLTMSMQTRDSLRAVRDAVNDACDEAVFTNDDVIRFALQTASRYHALTASESTAPDEVDDSLRPIAGVVAEVLDADDTDVSPAGRAEE